MPATSQIAGWTLSNLGPVTTTFTPAPSCSPPYDVGIGRYIDVLIDYDKTSKFSSLDIYGAPCTNTVASLAGCVPSGDVLDSQYNAYTKTNSGVPNTDNTLNYYSPATICPSGYATVGVATKSTGGAVSSSGPAFVPLIPFDDPPWKRELVLDDVAPNVLLENMHEGETAILCCPSNYTAYIDGTCSSILPAYPIPSEICVEYIPREDTDDEITVTETIFGTVYSGAAEAITGTIPGTTDTLSLSTDTATYIPGVDTAPSWVAADMVDVLYLVYGASETAAASSNATGKTSMGTTTKTALSNLVMLSIIGVAFITGFMLLIPM